MLKKIINLCIYLIVNLLLKIYSSIRRVRKVKFDYFPEEYKFYNKNYYFILFGKDKYVSRNTFVNGPHDFDLLKQSIKILNKKIFFLIDVGANVGTFCIPPVKDKIIKECIAVEPVKKICDILKINIYINNLKIKLKFLITLYLILNHKNYLLK